MNLSDMIIEAFEDFLEERDIRIPTSDREMAEDNALEDNEARIYGTDYGDLQGRIESVINEFNNYEDSFRGYNWMIDRYDPATKETEENFACYSDTYHPLLDDDNYWALVHNEAPLVFGKDGKIYGTHKDDDEKEEG